MKSNKIIKQTKRTLPGFTLLELIIALAIIGILATLSYPTYTDFTLKVRRTEAQGVLLELANIMERHYTTNGQYTVPTATGSYPSLPFTTVPKGASANDATYTLAFEGTVSASDFMIRATPSGKQSQDPCKTLRIGSNSYVDAIDPTSNGSKISGTECWRK